MIKEDVVKLLSPPLDTILCEKLIENYIKAKEDQFLGRWADAITTYGKFLEASAKAVYKYVFKDINDRQCKYCVDQIRSKSGLPKSIGTLLPTIIESAYNIRNNRDAAHISPIIDSNILDCEFSSSACDWVLCELLIEYGSKDRESAKNIIKSILHSQIPLTFENSEGNIMVITAGRPAWVNALVLMYSVKRPISLNEISVGIHKPKDYIRDQLTKKHKTDPDLFCILSDKRYEITPAGAAFIENIIKNELNINNN